MSTINHLQGYAFAKKKGDTIHVFEGPHTLADFFSVIAEGSDVSRMLKDRFADVVNVRDFGAVGDGVTDDSEAIQAADAEAFSSSKTVYFPSGIYSAKNLSMTASWNMDVHSWIRFNGETTDVVVTCTTDNVVGGNIQIDGNEKQSNKYLFRVGSDKCQFTSVTIKNATSNTDVVRALYVDGNYNHFISCAFYDLIKGSYDNDSSPQAACCLLNATGNVFDFIYSKNCRATFLNDSYGTNQVGVISACDSKDNGVYAVKGNTIVGCLTYEGVDTGLGTRHGANAQIGTIIVTGSESCAVFFGDCGNVSIGKLIAKNCRTCLFTNDADAGDISIGEIDAELTDGYPIYFSTENGPIKSLSIGSLNFNVKVNSLDNLSLGSFIRLSSCKQFSIGNITGRVTVDDDISTQIGLYIQLPTNVEKSSYLGEVRISIENESGNIPSGSAYTSITNSLQSHVRISNGVIQSNGNVFISPSNNSVPEVGLYSTSVPSAGYWLRGQVVWNTSNTSEIAGWICSTTGSGVDATWRVIPSFSSGNTTEALQVQNTLQVSTNFYPSTDNAVSLGNSSHRFSGAFLATSSISNSDSRVKSSVASASDTLLDAVGAIPIHTFQFTDAVEKKGADTARFHAGVIAQEVASAFQAKGLDAARYGLFCHDTWQDEYETVEVVDQPEVLDENGEVVSPAVTHTEQRLITAAGDRYGIRYEELLMLECARLRRELQRMKIALTDNGIKVGDAI